MRKRTFCGHATVLLAAACLWVSPLTTQAQTGRTVSGKVTDTFGQPIPGATVVVKGTSVGTVTDFEGNYTVKLPEDAKEIVVSFIGYDTETVAISGGATYNVSLIEDIKTLGDVVVIGYGTQRKGDLTGAISNVTADDFNQGLIGSAEQLINGKVSGVQIMNSGGSPTAGSTIKIRGGASLNASNDPLIVLDGVPLENGGISGNSSNFLSLINPADIESMTVLKDASSTAIYGSRASNGVIIITTKKGAQDKFKVTFSTTNSLQKADKTADMLSRDEFIDVVMTDGSADQQALLGEADTDWNDEIFRTAYGTDNNLSIAARAGVVPIRLSVGYYNQAGILDTDRAERLSGNLNVSPSLLDDHLKLNLGVKLSQNRNFFANNSAIWNAATENPTIEVYKDYGDSENQYGGYNEGLDADGKPVTGAIANPVGLLKQANDRSRIRRIVGNFDVDYKLHPLPELKFHMTLGYDYAKGQGKVDVPAVAYQYFTTGGRSYEYGPQEMTNKLLTIYLNYNKLFADAHLIDFTAGYDYQYWKSTTPQYESKNVAGEVQETSAASDYRHALLSYYGRLNYTLLDKYTLTATVRRDGTSRFSEDNRWGTFPSVALAWRLSDEPFLSDVSTITNLKLRASYGVTGQQEGIGNYNYIMFYSQSQAGAHYQLGDKLVTTLSPSTFVEDLKWETTKAWNFGLDFGFIDNRINGSIEYYTRKTEDLLATVPSPAGTNFDKYVTTNVGNVDSQGVEFNINGTPVDTDDWTLELSFNATWQKQTVKNLSLSDSGETTTTSIGTYIDTYQFQVLREGEAPSKFYLYHQLYDQESKPIEGAYADLNGDGIINSNDLYTCHKPDPDWMLGFSANLRFKQWSLGTSLRANLGNYVFNGMAMNTGALRTMSYNSQQLNNLNSSYLDTRFTQRQYLSDYYLENASFLKMDNVTLGYNFGRIADVFNLNATFMVQNVFTVTNYSGVDPEVQSGVDVTFYPRPRIFSLSLGFEF